MTEITQFFMEGESPTLKSNQHLNLGNVHLIHRQ